MESAPAPETSRMTYDQARRLVLAAGLGVLLLVAILMYARRVDAAEVGATLLFIPVFVAFVFWHLQGGVVAGVLASLGYVALRYSAISVVGAGQFGGLIVSRSLAYVAFGAIGGWASRQLEASLTKLELYDQIDDDTGLHNARSFLQETDLEIARAKRYRTIFSVAVLDIRDEVFGTLTRRRTKVALKDLGRALRSSVRTVDKPAHGKAETAHRFPIVLPETGPEGAAVFAERLASSVREHLRSKGIRASEDSVAAVALTYPEDAAALDDLRERIAAIDRTEHPTVSEETP